MELKTEQSLKTHFYCYCAGYIVHVFLMESEAPVPPRGCPWAEGPLLPWNSGRAALALKQWKGHFCPGTVEGPLLAPEQRGIGPLDCLFFWFTSECWSWPANREDLFVTSFVHGRITEGPYVCGVSECLDRLTVDVWCLFWTYKCDVSCSVLIYYWLGCIWGNILHCVEIC